MKLKEEPFAIFQLSSYFWSEKHVVILSVSTFMFILYIYLFIWQCSQAA